MIAEAEQLVRALLQLAGGCLESREDGAAAAARQALAAGDWSGAAAILDQEPGSGLSFQAPVFVANLLAGRMADAEAALGRLRAGDFSPGLWDSAHELLFRGTRHLGELVCPGCRGVLDPEDVVLGLPRRLRCQGCDAVYPVADGRVPMFLPEQKGSAAWQNVQATEPRWPKGAARLAWRAILWHLRRFGRGHDTGLEEIVARFRTPGAEPGFLFTRLLQSRHWWGLKIPEPSLEIGGGWGQYTNQLFGGRQRITYCSEYFAHNVMPPGLDRVHPDAYRVYDTVLIGSAHALPLPDASLRTVVAMHVLHHVPELEKALAEIARVLRPGGRLYATVETCHAWTRLPDALALRWIPVLGRRYERWRLTRTNPGPDIRAPYVGTGPYAQGMARFGLDRWRAIAGAVGLRLVEVKPYANALITGILRDARYQGLPCPEDMVEAVNDAVVRACRREVGEGLAFERAHCAFLDFEKLA